MLVYEVILQLGKHLLLQDAGSESWDKDVAMMIRCEKLHDSLAEEICHTSLRLSESHPVDEQRNILKCRRSVAIECISILYELERKRRRAMATALGDKKYLLFVAAMQVKLREINECLASGASGVNGKHVLDAYVAVFRWIPAELLEEWLMLSLGEIFETVGALNEALERCEDSEKYALVPLIGRLMEMFRVLLERISDSDLQTLLLRLLDRGFEPITPLLRSAITVQTPTNYAVQQVMGFLNAFAIIDRSLPLQNAWSRMHALDNERAELNEDDEEMEQRQSELLQRFLFFDEKNEVSTWEFMVRLTFSSYEVPATNSTDEVTPLPTAPTLPVFEQSYLPVEDDDNAMDAYYFPTIEMPLTLQRTLYASLSPDYNVEVDLSHAVARHVARLNECCRRVDSMAKCQASTNLCRVIELHLDCLIALANRRCIVPEIQAALDANRVLSVVVRHLPWSKAGINGNQRFGVVTPLPDDLDLKADTFQDPHIPEQHHSGCEEPAAASGPVSQLRLYLDQLNSGGDSGSGSERSVDSGVVGRVPLLKLSAPTSTSIFVRDGKLHALVIAFLVSYMLLEPSHELDDAFCPRYAPVVDQNGAGETNDDQSDLLWQLQRHLGVVQLDMRHFERVLFDMETTQTFVTASRASAIRNVERLLCPTVFDRTLYSLRERIHTARPSQTEGGDADRDRGRLMRSPRQEYIAKGATATVYRSTSAVPCPKNVAVKLIDYDHGGDRCVVGTVYNEVSILKVLRGERAALQLVDFGHHHEERSYEIVTEWCPCTLAEWRSSFSRQGSSETPPEKSQRPNDVGDPVTVVPFRACVLMILRCFRKVCVCLARIHARGVCHFDIKVRFIVVFTCRVRRLSRARWLLFVRYRARTCSYARAPPTSATACFSTAKSRNTMPRPFL